MIQTTQSGQRKQPIVLTNRRGYSKRDDLGTILEYIETEDKKEETIGPSW